MCRKRPGIDRFCDMKQDMVDPMGYPIRYDTGHHMGFPMRCDMGYHMGFPMWCFPFRQTLDAIDQKLTAQNLNYNVICF